MIVFWFRFFDKKTNKLFVPFLLSYLISDVTCDGKKISVPRFPVSLDGNFISRLCREHFVNFSFGIQ